MDQAVIGLGGPMRPRRPVGDRQAGASEGLSSLCGRKAEMAPGNVGYRT